MGFWRTLGSVFSVGVDSSCSSSTAQFDDTDPATSSIDDYCVNPATGLPMVGGMGGIDVHGKPFSTDAPLAIASLIPVAFSTTVLAVVSMTALAPITTGSK